MMAANNFDQIPTPTPTPIGGQIPAIPATKELEFYIPSSVVQEASDQGLPTVGAVTFADILQQTAISIPLDCSATSRKITDFGYILLFEDTAGDRAIAATLFPESDSNGVPVPNAKKGTLSALITKTPVKPKLRVTILTKKTVPPPNPIA
jgi:hypothetical protein